MSGDRVTVAEYGDLAARTDLSRREIDTLVGVLDETDARHLVLEEWLVDEKPIEPIDGWVRLFRVKHLLDETEKAWQVRVGDEECWIPKSQSTLIELADGVEAVESPSKTLTDFAGGESA